MACPGRTSVLTLTPPNPEVGQTITIKCTITPPPGTCGNILQLGGTWGVVLEKYSGGFPSTIFNDCNNQAKITSTDPTCVSQPPSGIFLYNFGPIAVTDDGDYICKVSGNLPSATASLTILCKCFLIFIQSKPF